MADDNLVDQDEIEQLLNQAKQEAAPSVPEGPAAAGTAAEKPPHGETGALATAGQQPDAAQPTSAAADDEKVLGQDDIEKLLSEAGTATATPASEPAAPTDAPDHFLPGEGSMQESDVEFLFNQAEQALNSIDATDDTDLPVGVRPFRLAQFSGAAASTENATLDLIRDVELDLKIELGRTHMYLEDVLKLRKGSVVPLDKLAGDPVDIYVNGRLIARGEVLVLNDNFCVRVAELIAGTNVFA